VWTKALRVSALETWREANAEDEKRPSDGTKRVTRAAEYVRMSTEHQKYSTENQGDAIREYAARRGIEIVRTYADAGKSGLSLDGRDALKQLIADVEGKRVDFATILVYDVSRWGRFQDADESAYYEYICKRTGISVQYCAEQFENDGSPVSTIVKGVKRAMAGEYSRELSAKVFTGQCRLIELGYRQGGPPGYGLRRQLIDQSGAAKSTLSRGEQKSLQTDRVVLVPGPIEETETIRWMYRTFVEDGKPEREIAMLLNAKGIATDLGRLWTRGTVHQILINEKYVGNNVWNKHSFKLKKKRVENSPDMWIRSEGAFEGIVDRLIFDSAQTIIRDRSQKLSDDQMLESLKQTNCRRAVPINAASAVCFVLINSWVSRQIGISAISKSTGPCASCIRASWPTRSPASNKLVEMSFKTQRPMPLQSMASLPPRSSSCAATKPTPDLCAGTFASIPACHRM
jgi:DNA invertase Pin-like site-specific DNA recombinase